jgi:CubicO group peptidase (beta-lactamase class C family)
MLQGGAWQRRNVLPTTWVRRISSLQTSAAEVTKTSPFEPGLGYGYLWWIFDPTGGWSNQLSGAYTASGAYGQFITVVPKLDMVVAHKTVVPPPETCPRPII